MDIGRGAACNRRMAAMARCRGGRRGAALLDDAAAADHLDLRFSRQRLAGLAHRPVEARAMSKPIRLTSAHQSITFSRRMLLLGGAQAAVGAVLIGRMGWLSVAQNQKYQL